MALAWVIRWRNRGQCFRAMEIADGDWMETAWLLRYELPDAFEEVLIILRDRIQKLLEQANELAAAEAFDLAGALDDEEDSAI